MLGLGRGLREYIAISISLVMFGGLLTIIIFFSQVGFSLLSIGEDNKNFKRELVLERELAFYNNTEITKDDVLIAVKTYTKEFKIVIDRPNPHPDIVLEPKASGSLWDVNRVESLMNTEKIVIYKSQVSESNTGIITLKFTIK